jgi:class 3 adenylate cyclase/tetratricopeptide (TPR) repeat protein
MTDLLTGTVTFLFTDIESSTELLKRLGKRYGEALRDHRNILRRAVREHGGAEIDTQGDSFLFAFPRADEAVVAAIDGQRALAAHEWPGESRVRVRMGIHTAEPNVADEGYYGLGVHRAARIMAAAHGGQVLVSLATASLLVDAELPEARLRDLGEHWLKDLSRPERICQLDVAGLKSVFPPPRAAERPDAQVVPEGEPVTADTADGLIERTDALSTLADSLAAVVRTAQGQLVLVSGEAGVGKTAMLRRFCDEHGRLARILWGACDPLFTPRPLGPLLDVADMTGGELAGVVEQGGRPQAVATALMRELGSSEATILVLDDVHWADEATLDVVALLGRRVDGVPALTVLSYRDDELDRSHPLRILLGALATARAVRRLEILPFSREAVARLAEPHGVNADELFGKTAGNPFFVTEALAAAEEELPHTVRDAVLARAARLSPQAAELLEAVAIAPPYVELWLLEALAGDVVASLDECLSSGMLGHSPSGVAFRHELARRAVEESLPPHRRLLLHRKALAALADPPTGAPDLERLAHHADAADDGAAVLRYAPAAAARAAALGAHREAAAQYARALRLADGLAPGERAELLERYSLECYLTDQPDEAINALRSAVECYRELGDTRKEGDSVRRIANISWCPGRIHEADKAAQQARTVLEQLPPGAELAMTYATMAQLRKDLGDSEGALEWGARAVELAERVDDADALIHALNTIGTTELLAGAPDGRKKLEHSLELAESENFPTHVGRAFVHLVQAATQLRTYEGADRYLERGLAYVGERGLDLWQFYLLAFRARMELDRGRWSEAVDSATLVFRKPVISTFPRILAFVVIGLVRARRGDPDVRSPLDDAAALAAPTGELPRMAPMAAARAEAAWLEGDAEGVDRATERAFELALQRGAAWPIGELAYWRWRVGLESKPPERAAEPYALQIAGDWAGAAELWAEIGCPYEAALALADADDADALRRGLAELERLGARPAAVIVRQRLESVSAT